MPIPFGRPRTLRLLSEHSSSRETSLAEAAVSYTALVLSVEKGDPEGLEELHRVMRCSARPYFGYRVGFGEADDLFADAFIAVVEAIQRGGLREPDRLMGFIATVLRRQLAAYIRAAIRDRRRRCVLTSLSYERRSTIEDDVLRRERADLLAAVLRRLSERDREVLCRFYLRNETKEHICAEMGLTDTQFRLLKSRAKARLTAHVQRRESTACGSTARFSSCA